ncbi:carbonic anhydrase 7-like [Topomyia yanbarensis]|uniref:carbonic anhydrase 7-like n=1 Tax=Topomyia yanbarensis TaxID=2498891 RepID=UPI00273B2EBB|nr:carbonic anhydrase 7-like [Topomyia yanbarensis]
MSSNRRKALRQSPIALSSTKSMPAVEKRPLELLGYQEDPIQVIVTNNGHSALFTFQFPCDEAIIERGGPLPGEFQFDSLHFHWGANSKRGAEHVIKGRRYAMEMHLVFFNRQYDSFMEARTEQNGLSVLGIFFDKSCVAPDYGWIAALSKVRPAGASYALPDPSVFNIKELIGQNRRPYFYYHGSLTSPPFFETVCWIVQKTPLPISEAQLKMFRSLRNNSGEPLVDNYRELQDSNRRPVFRYR